MRRYSASLRIVAGVAIVSAACGGASGYEGIDERHPTGSAVISAEGLVAAYDMETLLDDGRLRDFGPHEVHGVVGTALPEPGRWGGAIVFDDPADRIDIPDDRVFDQPGPLTIAAWLRVDETGHHQHVAACDDSWALWVTPADQYRLGDTRGTGFNSAAGSIRRGEWQSVVAVFSGTRGDSMTTATAIMYVDGVRSAGSTGTRWNPGPLYPADACYLGFESHQGNAAHQELPFYGGIDELLIFSRAWTADEVAAHAARPPH